MVNISVVVTIFNEEGRIRNFLDLFSWSNDIVIVDKSSTDKTAQIINENITPYINLVQVPYTDSAYATQKGIDVVKNDWFFVITASDAIDYSLVEKIQALINDNSFSSTSISLPFKMFVLGINDSHSPWGGESISVLYKKGFFLIKDRVHEERNTVGDVYVISSTEYGYFYHLTHRDFSSLLERHIRYTQQEVKKYEGMSLKQIKKKSLRHVLSSLKTVFLRKKTYKLGWDGLALSLAFISYYLMEYVFVWQYYRCQSDKVYDELVKSIIMNNKHD